MSDDKLCRSCGWRPGFACEWWLSNSIPFAIHRELEDRELLDHYVKMEPQPMRTLALEGAGCLCWKPIQEAAK